MQTLDLMTKAAVVGAIGFIVWHTFLKEGVVERGSAGRFLKGLAGRFTRGRGRGGYAKDEIPPDMDFQATSKPKSYGRGGDL
jgi:hypothetical protein